MTDATLPKIGKPAERALATIGVSDLTELRHHTEAGIAKLHGMGPKALGMLKEALRATGRGFKSAYAITVRVYYEDTDFSGNVYHAAYLHFFERGRTEFLRAHDIHHSELAGEGIAFAVRSMQIEFEAAAHIDDELVVETRVLAVTGARMTLEQTIARGGTPLTWASVVVAAITAKGRPARLPKALRERLAND